MDFKKIALAFGALALATSASAYTQINGTGLQDALDARTQGGAFLDVHTNQHTPSSVWNVDSAFAGHALMMFEMAGFANSNTMGIYDINNIGNTLELFNGPASTGFTTSLALNGSNFIASSFNSSGLFLGQNIATFSSSNFGFYLSTPQNNTFYSQAHLNADSDNDGEGDTHMVAFQGDNNLYIQGQGNYGLFTTNNFVLAWEDLILANSDRDYNDMVVMVNGFVPVPEPGTLALLGLGLAGLGMARRRKVTVA